MVPTDVAFVFRRKKVADLVPVDTPINLAIAAAWKIAVHPVKGIPVYNCTSGSSNPITWGQMETLGMAALREYPMENVVWYPGGSYKENPLVHKIYQVINCQTKILNDIDQRLKKLAFLQ